MSIFQSIDFPRALMLLGLGAWLVIAVVNNIRDRGTNIFLLGIMFSMALLKEDPNMGNGLKHRAIDSKKFHASVLSAIVAYQVLTACLLLIAAAATAARWLGMPMMDATTVSNLALALFASLWIFFMSGGLWFGYWMKQVQVQQVHMTLVLISLGMFIFVNLPAA